MKIIKNTKKYYFKAFFKNKILKQNMVQLHSQTRCLKPLMVTRLATFFFSFNILLIYVHF
jgi:hypothetical protein